MPGDDERFQVCDQFRSRHSTMSVEETRIMELVVKIVGFVLLWFVVDSFINWMAIGIWTPRFTLFPWRLWVKSQRKKALVLTVNTVGRQLKTACINEVREQSGEEVERPNVYFGEQFLDISWPEAVKSLKTGWASLRDKTMREYPNLNREKEMPHFNLLAPLTGCHNRDKGDSAVVRPKPLTR